MKKLILSFIFLFVFINNSFAFFDRTGRLTDNSFWFKELNSINLEFQYLDKNFDPFDVIKNESKTINLDSISAPGDMVGGKLKFFYNFSPLISAELTAGQADYDYGLDSIKVDQLGIELNLKKQINRFVFVFSAGYEYMNADDIKYSNLDNLNFMAKRIFPGQKIEVVFSEENGYGFKKDKTAVFSKDAKNLDKPYISIKDMDSSSFYSGASIHYNYNKIYSGFFGEIGKTKVNAAIDTNLDDYSKSLEKYMTENQKKALNSFPINLDRDDETYFSAGTYLQFPLIFDLKLNLVYTFIRFNRDSDLDYEPDNHALNVSLIYPLTEKISLNFGGQYLYRQLNGVVPFLYNKYTQTTFDHKYGYLHAGLTYSF